MAAVCSAANAELTVTESQDGSPEVYQLTITPAAEPEPALRHRLITPPHRLNRGNAPAYYRRVHGENNLRGVTESLKQQFGETWYDWVSPEPSLSEIPLASLRAAVRTSRGTVNNFIRPGTLCRGNDWGLAVEDMTGPDIVSFLLPEFQGMRQLCRINALHTRLAIADGRFDDAIEHLTMNYRMGRDTAETPFLVCGLVGMAMVGITNSNTLDLITAPDSPNLYWALSELPDPIVSLEQAVKLEVSLVERMFPLLAEAETATYADDEWNRRWAELQSGVAKVGPSLGSNPAQNSSQAMAMAFATVSMSVMGYPHAKQRLVDWGYDTGRVAKMPVGQVMAIYSSRVYRIHAQNLLKAWYVPFQESREFEEKLDADLAKTGPLSKHPNRQLLPLASMLLPSINASRVAQMRTRREIALMRAIEAVRMHAAATGALPKSLGEVTCVPVPDNPATGEPFQYESEQANFVFGDEAAETGLVTFVLPKSDGAHVYERRYELRLAK